MSDSGLPLPNKRALYDTVTCILSCVLQADNAIQKQSMHRLKQVQVIEEYPLVLADIIGCSDEARSERHLASVFLKNYLKGILAHENQNPALRERGYGKVLALRLIEEMTITDPPIRRMVIECVVMVLGMGFWNSSAVLINNMIQSQDITQVTNAVEILHRVINVEYYQEGTDRCGFAPHWFDVLLNVFTSQNIPSEVRSATLQPLLVLILKLNPEPNYLTQCLTRITDASQKVLLEPFPPNSDSILKLQVMQFFNSCTDKFTTLYHVFIPPLLPTIGILLPTCCELFKGIIKDMFRKNGAHTRDDPEHFFDLLGSILKFICSLIDLSYFDVLIEDLQNLIYCIYVFMACHTNMEEQLYVDPLDRSFFYTVREMCKEILLHLLVEIQKRRPDGRTLYMKTMNEVFRKLSAEIDITPHSTIENVQYKSRITESMIYGVGSFSEHFDITLQSLFPLKLYLTVWTDNLSVSDEILQGRVIWVGGIYSTFLNQNMVQCHFNYIKQNLSAKEHFNIVPSMQALSNHLKCFHLLDVENQNIIRQFVEPLLSNLLSITRTLNSYEVLFSLQALGYLVKCQRDVVKKHVEDFEDVLMQTIGNFHNSPEIMAKIRFICAKMSQAQVFKPFSHDKFLRFLIQWVQLRHPLNLKCNLDIPFDLLGTVSLYLPSLDTEYVFEAFTAAANRLTLNNHRDIAVDDTASNLLLTLVVKATDQLNMIVNWPKGQPIVTEYPKLLEFLMQPDVTFLVEVLGKLVVCSMYSLPAIMQPHCEVIIKNAITSSAVPQCPKLKSNWIIFLFITMIRPSDTLNALASLPGPNGGSALKFMMEVWSPEFFEYVDLAERKIMLLAIVQILRHCLEHSNDRERLEEVTILTNSTAMGSTTSFNLTGMEYFYHLLIQFLVFEKVYYDEPLVTLQDFHNFAEDKEERSGEDSIALFYLHPFNISIVDHIIEFLKTRSSPYYTVLKNYVPHNVCSQLREWGCSVPEEEMHFQEAME